MKAANNLVRDMFVRSVAGLFGGGAQIRVPRLKAICMNFVVFTAPGS